MDIEKYRKRSKEVEKNPALYRANEILNLFYDRADHEYQFCFNTTAIKKDVIYELIKKGFRVFERDPLYSEITGYPLQIVYWGYEKNPVFNVSSGTKMIETKLPNDKTKKKENKRPK